VNQLATLSEAQLPAHIQGDGAQAAALVTSESVPRISLRDASFRLKKDGNEINVGIGKPLKVVILGIDPPEAKRTSKQFYEGAWSEDSADAPDCYSKDGVRPDPSVAEPQCDNCAQCSKNAWGSGHDAEGNASKGKACSDRKNLFVVVAGKSIDGDVFTLSIPPTSLKALSAFGRDLVRYNVNMHKIITQIDVDPDNAKGMLFNYAGFLEEAPASRMAARAASPELTEMSHPTALLAAPAASATGMSMASPEAAAAGDDDLDLTVLGSDVVVAETTQREKPATKPAATETVKNPLPDEEVDSEGCPYDARIHAKNKSKLGDGQWRLARGVDKQLVEDVMAEIMPLDAVEEQTQAVETATEEAAESADAQELDDLLDNWGDSVC